MDYLCLAGCVALNCVSNGKLLRSGIFKDIYKLKPGFILDLSLKDTVSAP